MSMTQRRVRILHLGLVVLGLVLASRLFYIQIVRGEAYSNLALEEQLRKYEIEAERGQIYAREGDDTVPLVLNETRKTLYADPRFVEDELSTAQSLATIIGGNIYEYEELMSDKERAYVVLGKRLTLKQAEAIEALELPGIGLQDTTQRSYPEGSLAAQLLGFTNVDGVGQYGVESALESELKGQPGLLRAVTDARGIPLTTADDSIIRDPVHGTHIVLTIDRRIQSYVEQALKRGVESAEGKGGSAIVMDPHTGAVLAMANYPSYDPAKYFEAKDPAVYLNGVTDTPYEVGSVIKAFTMAIGLEENAVEPDEKYFDAGYVQVDDRRIENAGTSGGVERTMTEVIQKSVNTGVIYVLQQLSGDNNINQSGRETLYDYFYHKFGFGSLSGIEQSAEAQGIIYDPFSPEGNNVRYANMTFGQGMSLTMVQVAAGFSALVNGGTYYEPQLIHSRIDPVSGQEEVVAPVAKRGGIISKQTSNEIRKMMEQVVEFGGGYAAKRQGYLVGGKTGTSQKLNPDGTYSDFLEIGSFIGFGAGTDVEYVIMTKVDEPQIPGYAGTVAAAPIFADISNFLIDYYRIAPVR